MSKAAELAKVGEVFTNGQLSGRRNMIINGAYQIAQRATSSTGQGADEGYKTVDRWNYTVGGTATAGRFTLTQDTSDAPTSEGFGFCTKFDCTTADTSIAAGEALIWRTKLEGGDLQGIKKGTSNAEKITLSFYAKGTAATYAVELHDEDNSRHNTQKFTVTTSWQRFELTFAADTTGEFNNDQAASLGIAFWLHGGSDYTGGTFTSNTWASRTAANVAVGIDSFYSSTDNEFFITGIQLEVGSVATPFEHRSFGEEMQLCQRYFVRLSRNDTYGEFFLLRTYDTSNGTCAHHLPVPMRTSPTLETSTVNSSNFAYSLSALSIGHASTNFQNVELFATGSFTANGAAVVQKANNTDVITIDFKAEL
tara:strand:+ start:1697 stop:2794 length:1098 start_codon:yes stop_codon:yes gene_type:complete